MNNFGIRDNVARLGGRAADERALTKEEHDFEVASAAYFAASDRFEIAKKNKKVAELKLDLAADKLGKRTYRSSRVVLIQAGDYPGQLPLDIDDRDGDGADQ